MTTNRWKNTVTNAEADSKANIATDHYPVIMEIAMKLKAKNKIAKPRKRYRQQTAEENEEFNNKFSKLAEEEYIVRETKIERPSRILKAGKGATRRTKTQKENGILRKEGTSDRTGRSNGRIRQIH